MEQLEEMGAIVLGKTNLNVSKTCAFVSSLVDVCDIGVLQLQCAGTLKPFSQIQFTIGVMQIQMDGRGRRTNTVCISRSQSQTKQASDIVYDPSSLIQLQADQFLRIHVVLQQVLQWVSQQAMLHWL